VEMAMLDAPRGLTQTQPSGTRQPIANADPRNDTTRTDPARTGSMTGSVHYDRVGLAALISARATATVPPLARVEAPSVTASVGSGVVAGRFQTDGVSRAEPGRFSGQAIRVTRPAFTGGRS